MASRNYRDLVVWQKSMDLCEDIYRATKSLPKEEQYGLTSQLRRAAISIPSNIAEGEGRNAKNELRRFLAIAHGSLRELETQVLLTERLGYLDAGTVRLLMASAGDVGRLINGLRRSLGSGE